MVRIFEVIEGLPGTPGTRIDEEYIQALIAENKSLKVELQKYKPHSELISRLNDCNDCGIKKSCKIKPKLGEQVRINCFMWVE